MFCAGDRSEETGDLAHYSPGSHLSVFSIRGVRCGALICHDYRYAELYREYKRRGVQLMFYSFHAGNVPPERFRAMREAVGEDL
jgi:predicted amidohydrolase